MAAYPFYVARVEDDSDAGLELVEGFARYHEAREAAERWARRSVGDRFVILQARETLWSEAVVRDDLSTARAL